MEATIGTQRTLTSLTVALGPPVVWSVHLLLCYLLVYATGDLGDGAMRIQLTLVTLGALALIATTTVVAWRSSRPSSSEGEALTFLDDFGLWSAGLFGLGTILTAAPIYFLRTVAA